MTVEKGVLRELAEVREECYVLFGKADEWLTRHGGELIAQDHSEPIRLALCGTYNSGKSTIVNALLGEMKAVTGDFPVTKKAHDYDWRGYHIVDLPGYDAREVESEVARKEVRNADVVLYVVSSQTGLDHESTWKDIEGLAADKIPFLVVINDKQPVQDDEHESTRKEKIQSNYFSKASKKLDSGSSNTVHWVRANRAEKGRAEKKTELVRKSGIEQLEADILQKLGTCDVIVRLLKQVAQYKRALTEVRDKLSEQMKTDAERKLSDILKQCSGAREQLQDKAAVISQENFGSLKELIIGSREGDVVGVSSSVDLTDESATTYSKALDFFASAAQEKVRPIYDQLNKDIADYGIDTEPLNIAFPPIGGVGAETDVGKDLIKNGLKTAIKALWTELTKETGKETLKQGSKEALKQTGKETLKQGSKEGLKQTGKETLKQGGKEALKQTGKETIKQGGKQAAKEFFKKWLGPAIEIIDGLNTARQGWIKEREEKKKIEAALRQINAQASLIVTRVKQQFATECSTYVNKLLDPLEKGIKEQVNEKKKFESDLLRQYTYGNELREHLENQSSKLFAWAQSEKTSL